MIKYDTDVEDVGKANFMRSRKFFLSRISVLKGSCDISIWESYHLRVTEERHFNQPSLSRVQVKNEFI